MAKQHGCPVKLAGNEIVKWLISIVVSCAILAGCIAVYNCANAPVPGEVFVGKAQGMMCEIVAEVTVNDGKIADVKLTGADETPSLGGVVLEEMPTKIIAAQSADVDGMTGATVTTDAVKAAVNDALAQAGLYVPAATEAASVLADGSYSASAQGFGGDITVEVTVSGGKITDVKITGENETPTLGGAAVEQMPEQFLAAQSGEVDGVAGATVSSNAIRQAFADALAKAGA